MCMLSVYNSTGAPLLQKLRKVSQFVGIFVRYYHYYMKIIIIIFFSVSVFYLFFFFSVYHKIDTTTKKPIKASEKSSNQETNCDNQNNVLKIVQSMTKQIFIETDLNESNS